MECETESDVRVTSPNVETLAFLQDALAKGDTLAVVSQDGQGNLTISAEIGPGSAFLGLTPLVGPEGAAGQSQFPLLLQEEVFDDPSDLPTDLTPTAADIGRYWIIDVQNQDTGAVTSTGAYIWFGSEFRFLPFGNQGPPGPYGVIAPFVTLLPPDNASQPVVTGSGVAGDPYLWTLELSVPEGPVGPCCPVAEMPDFQSVARPTVGQFITATGEHIEYGGHSLPLWAPANVGDIVPACYTVPQSAFTAAAGITFESTVTIATFSVPANAWPWKPIVFGQIQMYEAELSFNPLAIGIEVLLGSPNPEVGTLVARGYGNTPGGVVTIVPHTSSPSSPSTAMTPWNSVGLVAANHGGPAATLYVNLINDGIVAVWDYNPQGAEIFVMACPSTSQEELGLTIYGSLHPKVTLSGYTAVRAELEFTGTGVLTAEDIVFSPVSEEFVTSGTYTPPSWWTSGTDFLDLIAVGAGGGGSTAGNNDAGGPGGAGSWNTTTIQTLSSGHLTVTVGGGGTSAASEANGTAGAATTIKDGGTTKLTAAGGSGGTYEGGGTISGTGWYGPSPGNETYESQTYYGGQQQTSSSGNGQWPGGGAAGADHIFVAGGHGASGAAWIVARKA